MSRLTAAQIAEKARELKPARLFAFKLWQKNPQITTAELSLALKEKGFEVAKSTRSAWLIRFRRGQGIDKHAKRLRPVRLFVFKLWQENPQITGAELGRALEEKGVQAHRPSCYVWLRSFRKGEDVGTSQVQPVEAVEPGEITLE